MNKWVKFKLRVSTVESDIGLCNFCYSFNRLVNENLHSTMSRTNCNRNFSIIFANYNVCSNTEKKLHSFISGIAEKIELKRRSPRNVQQISRRPIYWWCVTVSVDIKYILPTVHVVCMFTCFKGLLRFCASKCLKKSII